MAPHNEHKSLWRPIGLLVAVVILGFIAQAIGAGRWLDRLQDWILHFGTMGIVIFVIAYIVGVVMIIPSSALTLIAGAIFGPVLGIVLVSVGATIGGGVAFLIARYFAREPMSQWLHRSQRFQKLDALTETHGSVMVAVARLVPILPFTVSNYAFGLTRVQFRTFMFWSWVCMLPATAIYVLGVDVVREALTQRRISWALGGYFAFLVAALMIVNRIARRRLDEAPSPVRNKPNSH